VTNGDKLNERLLVLMPTAKDAERTVASLAEANVSAVACSDLAELCREIGRGAGAALLTEEAIVLDQAGCLKESLRAEPSWSGFPLIVLAREGRKQIGLPDDLALHATLVERPVRMVTLRSVVDTALRHRRRQYELRGVLADLERARAELEQKVNERTARLRELIAELEAFSYSVSHDLRAPLRAMQGYAEALLEEETDALSERGKVYLARIHRASARLDLLIQDVLAYTRVSKGEIQLRPIPVGPLIDDILRSYPEISEKATITVEQPLPLVIGHEGYLSQCIANILGNAVKFVAPGVQARVRVWAETLDDRVRINFEDNGIGIAAEHRDQIFQLFGRINAAEAFAGTGIGLAIVKKASERMGGSVGVESELGRGSRFWITLRKA
jgi:signal transduction histidine kinase